VPSDMIAVPIGPARRFAVVAPPGYFEANGKPRIPPDLPRHACLRIRLPNGALYSWQFEKGEQPVQIEVDGPIKLDEASLTRFAVLDGMGIAYATESVVREDIGAGRLVRVLEDWTPPLSPVCLYYANRRNTSAAFRAFIDMAHSLTA
jgi:DNA-binding transcriptional LysR family regulator